LGNFLAESRESLLPISKASQIQKIKEDKQLNSKR